MAEWKTWFADCPSWHDVGKIVEIEIDGKVIRGELEAEESTSESENPIFSVVSGDEAFSFYDSDRFRFV